MPSQVVRQTFRDTLQAAFPGTPYVESIAMRVDNITLPPLWMSLEFIGGADAPMCIGKPTLYRENGIARIWVCAIAGEGDSDAVEQGDLIAAFYRGWSDAQTKIKVQTALSPSNGPESDGRWFMAYVDVAYQHDYYG